MEECNYTIDFFKVADSLGISSESAEEMFDYFYEAGFLICMSDEGDIKLSHKAIDEVEKSLNNPQQSTEHFSSTVIQNFHAPVGSVQTGNYNIANVNQYIGQNFSEILVVS